MTCSRLGVAGLGQETGGLERRWRVGRCRNVGLGPSWTLTGRSKVSCVMGFCLLPLQLPLDFSAERPRKKQNQKLQNTKTGRASGQQILLLLFLPQMPNIGHLHIRPRRVLTIHAKSSRPMIAVAVSGRNKAGGHPLRPAACRRMQEHVRDSPSSVQQQDDRNWPASTAHPIRQALLHHHRRTILQSTTTCHSDNPAEQSLLSCPFPRTRPAQPSLVPTPQPNPTSHLAGRGRRPRDWRLLLFSRRTA